MSTPFDSAQVVTHHASPEAAAFALDHIIDRLFIFEQLWDDLPEKPVGPALLYRVPSRAKPDYFLLQAGETFVGRLPKALDSERGCDLAFPDAPELSRRHCVIRGSDGEFILEDLQSTSGTFVNISSNRLTEPKRLVAGDIVYVGGVVLVPTGF